MHLLDLLAADTPRAHAPPLREGHDFCNQEQLRELQPAGDMSASGQCIAGDSLEVRAAELAAAVLNELRMSDYTGQLPGRGSWSDQPAWRVELWRAYWQAKTAAEDSPELNDPDYCYD